MHGGTGAAAGPVKSNEMSVKSRSPRITEEIASKRSRRRSRRRSGSSKEEIDRSDDAMHLQLQVRATVPEQRGIIDHCFFDFLLSAVILAATAAATAAAAAAASCLLASFLPFFASPRSFVLPFSFPCHVQLCAAVAVPLNFIIGLPSISEIVVVGDPNFR